MQNSFVTRHWALMISVLIWLAIYFLVFFSLKIGVAQEIMFSSPDSQEYLVTGAEFLQREPAGFSHTRPFLFPVLLYGVHHILGVVGIWAMQLLMWLASLVLLYVSILNATRSVVLAVLGGTLMAINFTLIALTLHGLTEVLTIFLLTVLLHVISHRTFSGGRLKRFHAMVLILVVLTVVKPLFFPMVLVLVLGVAPLFHFRKYVARPQQLVVLLLVLAPLLFQMGWMKAKHDSFSVSQISSRTFKEYLLAQTISNEEGIPLEMAIEQARTFTPAEVRGYTLSSKGPMLDQFWQNVNENTTSISTLLLYPPGHEHPALAAAMGTMNTRYMVAHKFFLLPMLALLALHLVRRAASNRILQLVVAGTLTYFILFTSGISAYQGDRLTLPALPLFLFLYAMVINGWLAPVWSMARQR
jgi:hypothetical protein